MASDAPSHLRSATAVLVGPGPRLDSDGPPAALVPILGRSPLQRHAVQLAKLGVERGVLVLDGGLDPEAVEAVEALARRQLAEVDTGSLQLQVVREMPTSDRRGGEGRTLWIRAEGVYDPRLYDAVLEAEPDVWLADGASGAQPGGIGGGDGVDGADRPDGAPRPIGLATGSGGAFPGPDSGGEPLPVSALPEYLPSLRRRLRPYWCLVASGEARERAGGMILDATQKGVLDFPARFFHPPLENALTRLLAPVPVTPNQVTVVTGLLGFLAAGLFATGGYALALALAFVVNVLDGVDGKLARVKLMTSRFGDRLDHTLDVVFEFSWYLGIGWGLSGGDPGGVPFGLAVGLIVVMLGTRGMSGVYKLVTGRQIHDHRAFDRAFRLVAGRRNVYVVLLVAGLLAGVFRETFTLCFAWAVATLLVYTLRSGVEALRKGSSTAAEGRAG